MKLDVKKYWVGVHQKYLTLPWINKPSIFATQVVKHFPKKGKLLDLGAGQGQDSRFFAKMGYDVLCTDYSDFALKIAKEKASKDKLTLKFLEVDISNKLPFSNNEFDIVYSHMALHYWGEEETHKVFREIHRILETGGVFAAVFNSQSDPEIKEVERVGKNLYFDPKGLVKSYFTANYLKRFIGNKFETILLDGLGETHKDRIKTLVRFIGKKI